MPAFLSVSCISMNPSNKFFGLIAVVSIDPASLSSITIMYLFLHDDVIGNAPVWLLDVISFKSLE